LINLGLPQAHSLSYFNVAAGVIGGFTRSSTFGFVPATTQIAVPGYPPYTTPSSMNLAVDKTTGCTISSSAATTRSTYYCPAKLGFGPRSIDPVLVLTLYFPPVDAERQWRMTNPRDWIPGLSFGASLSNPTSNFYVGGSNEIAVRNIQLVYGFSWQKMATGLANPGTQPPFGGVGAAPAVATVQGFHRGFFVGMTYNLSSFFQSLGLSGAASKSP
jgi:hypothetical protein